MKVRILVGVCLVAILALLLILGGYPLMIALAVFSCAAVYEMGLALRNKGLRPWLYANYALALAAPFLYFLFGIVALLIAYVASVAVTMVCSLLIAKTEAQDMMAALFIHEYPTLMLICMALVYFSFDRAIGLTAACLAFAAPSFTDSVAYFVGTLFGRHKLCPAISPHKTVEGACGALLGGIVFGAILIPLQTLWHGMTPPLALLLIGLGCGVFSQIGDFVASFVKRWAGIKDYSSIFPGHGGVLDRLDSILFCSPFVLVCMNVVERMGTR